MNQILALLAGLIDSRKDNRTTIGTLAACAVLYLASTGKITQELAMAALGFITVATGVSVGAIAHEDAAVKTALPPPPVPAPLATPPASDGKPNPPGL